MNLRPPARNHLSETVISGAEQVRDQVLVLRCQQGDVGAFEELVARWQRRLWTHARRLTGDPDAAWDVLQESWIAMLRGLDHLDDPAAFPTWAFRIVGCQCAQWVRQRQRDRRRDEQVPANVPAGTAGSSQPPEVALEALERSQALDRALATLDFEHRQALVLFYLDGLTLAATAHAMAVPEGTVKSRLHHARAQLRRIMETSL